MTGTISSDILNYLPEFMRDEPGVQALVGGINPLTGQAVTYGLNPLTGLPYQAGIGGFLQQLSDAINIFQYYNDFANCPINQLSSFVAQYGITFPPAMGEAAQRKLARDVIAFNRANGSIRTLEYIFSIIGIGVEVQYTWMLDSDIVASQYQTANFNYIFSNPTLTGTTYLDYLTVTDGGSGYTGTPTVTFTGGGGTGAAATAIVTANVITGFIVTDCGSGYTSVPSVSITGGGGIDATATAVMSLGQREDGTATFHDGVYFFGTAQTTQVYYPKMPIKFENYIPGAYTDSLGRVVAKLPYLFLNVTAHNYNSLTANWTDPTTGIVYPFSASDKFALIEQITNYFLEIARPANVVFLSLSTPFQLSDTITSAPADEGVIVVFVNAGLQYDGTATYGSYIDRYQFGLNFGGFQYGNTAMTPAVGSAGLELVGRGYTSPALTYTNGTGKSYYNSSGVLSFSSPNVWPDEYNPVTLQYQGKSIWQGSTNLLLNSGAPVTQVVTLGTGTFTLWCLGSGTAVSSAGTATGTGFGTATGSPAPFGVSNTFTISGAGTVNITVSGSLTLFQLEKLPFPTPYIPTTGSSASRDTDLAVISVSNVEQFNPALGTFVTGFTTTTDPEATQGGVLLTGDGDAQYMASTSTTWPSTLFSDNGTVLTTANTVTANTSNIAGVSFQTGSTLLCLNGGTVASNAGDFSTPTDIYVGSDSSTGQLNGWISALTYYPYAMTLSQLQNISAFELPFTFTKTYGSLLSGMQPYLPVMANSHINLTGPVGWGASILTSLTPRIDMCNAQFNYSANPIPANFAAFGYQPFGTLVGKAMSAAGTLTYTINTITRTTGSWTTDGFVAGDQLIISGSSITQNNGVVFTIANVNSATEITVNGNPTAGTSTGDVIVNCFDAQIQSQFAIGLNVTSPVAGSNASLAVTLLG